MTTEDASTRSGDVTEGAWPEELLRTNLPVFRRLFYEAVSNPILLVDEDGRYVEANEAALSFLECSREELLSRAVWDWTPPELEKRERSPLMAHRTIETEYCVHGKVKTLLLNTEPIQLLGRTLLFSIGQDITDRKRLEAMLRAGEERYRDLAESITGLFFAMDRDLRYTYWNKASEDFTGISAKDAVGKTIFEVFPDTEDTRRAAALYQEVLKTGRPKSLANEYLHAGKTHFFELSASPTRDGLSVHARDITERKRAEDALKESEENFKALAENAFDGIAITTGGAHIYANKRAAEITGYSVAEFLRTAMKDLVRPDEFEKTYERYRRRLAGEAAPSPYETVIIRKDGRSVPIELAATQAIWQHKPADMVFFRDITERKRTQDRIQQYSTSLEEMVSERTMKLAESERSFRELAELTPEIVCEIDLDGHFTYVNPAGYDVTGYSPEDVRGGLNAFQTPIPEDRGRLKEDIERRLRGEQRVSSEYTIMRKDGSTFPILMQSSPIIREGKPVGLRVVVTDVTQLRRTQRLATIGELATMVGHDLRNPLTSMITAAHYLKTNPRRRIGREERQMLNVITEAVRRSEKIVSDLLEYSGELRLELSDTNPRSLISKSLGMVRIPKNVRLVNSTRNQPRIRVDVEKLTRVFVNLMRNAVEAMPEGGKLRITSREVNGNLQTSFADTGAGMTADIQGKIWDPLFTTKSKGIGLGLPIVKRLVEAHRGSVTVETEPGKGSTFTVTIPTRNGEMRLNESRTPGG